MTPVRAGRPERAGDVAAPPPAAPATIAPRRCGFSFTTTGRPCGNRVAPGSPWCRAGHPCPPEAGDDAPAPPTAVGLLRPVPPLLPVRVPATPGGRRPPGPGRRLAHRAPPGGPAPPRRAAERRRRAAGLLREAVASDDTEGLGLRADHVLADPRVALGLLGGPEPWLVARQAVVQHYGLVGAYLVVAYEERGAGRTEPGSPLERLVRHFASIDVAALYRVLEAIDGAAPPLGRAGARPDAVADAHRWLHATYALAARDGTAASHRAYMRALDDVMRQVRPLVAS